MSLNYLYKRKLLMLFYLLLSCSLHAQQNLTVRMLFVEDQRDRGIPYADDGVHMLSKADTDKLPDHSKEIGERDVERLRKTRLLLQHGALVTALDYRFAAILFQHGQQPEDYLLAHVLAIRAIGLGDLSSQNLAAITLDRYLQSIGRGQIFGSQYLSESYSYRLQHASDKDVDVKAAMKGDKDTLQPYDESLLSDSLRRAFCIVGLVEQKKAVADAYRTGNLEIPVLKECHWK